MTALTGSVSLLVLATGLSLPAGSARAASVEAAGSRIVEVTVFPDRAEVMREVRLELPAGVTSVSFPGLPWSVETDSLRVTAKGVPAALGAVELKEAARAPVETPDFIAARDDVHRLEMDLAGLASQAAIANEMREFIGSLKATAAQRESERLGEGRPDPASLQATYALVKTSLQELARDDLARTEGQLKLQKEIDVARARLASLRPAGAIRSRVAAVEVETDRAGPLTLRIAYLAPGASWRPAYRASLDAASGEIQLDSEAVVEQTTGEDWTGVSLKLSTAAPARGVTPPELTSWLLRPVELLAQAVGGFADALPSSVAGNLDMLRMKSDVADDERKVMSPAKEEVAARVDAGIVHTAYNVAFTVAGRSDVPADGREHRVGLRQETIPARLEYRSVPPLGEAAYLLARGTAPGGYPLLAGPVHVFTDGAYLGVHSLPETAPGAELTLPFGADNRIRVERTPLPQARSHEGFIGRDRQITYAFHTTVENLRDRAAGVIVQDRIPVSEDERITVERGRQSTPGAVDVADRPGIIEWKLDLKPGEKRELTLTYSVRFPNALSVPGLD
ncbi:MAG TPA: DUF4139 domain-containing protein [Candidatus Polarisedimenticolia bacterium]|nr:DUF4139 domain-containing protein [Candidatus Polarisedimenticolia bacterium]